MLHQKDLYHLIPPPCPSPSKRILLSFSRYHQPTNRQWLPVISMRFREGMLSLLGKNRYSLNHSREAKAFMDSGHAASPKAAVTAQRPHRRIQAH